MARAAMRVSRMEKSPPGRSGSPLSRDGWLPSSSDPYPSAYKAEPCASRPRDPDLLPLNGNHGARLALLVMFASSIDGLADFGLAPRKRAKTLNWVGHSAPTVPAKPFYVNSVASTRSCRPVALCNPFSPGLLHVELRRGVRRDRGEYPISFHRFDSRDLDQFRAIGACKAVCGAAAVAGGQPALGCPPCAREHRGDTLSRKLPRVRANRAMRRGVARRRQEWPAWRLVPSVQARRVAANVKARGAGRCT
jgi:hypothetical protein